MRNMDFEEYKAKAIELYKKASDEDLKNHKFKRGSLIKVCDEMPPHMSHFESGFKGIVEYTYGQKYGGDNVNDYSLIVLNDEYEPINSISWYKEDQLELLSDDVEIGILIIKAYEARNER